MTRLGHWIMISTMWLLCAPVLALDASVPDTATDIDEARAAAAIRSILEPTNKLMGNDEEIDRIARALVAAGRAHSIPYMLLVAMAHHETRFRGHLIGGLGEVGIIQVHGVARRGCDLSDVEGQAMCGATWLRRMADHCGGLEAGLTAYACGSCVTDHGSRAFYAVRRRLRLYSRLDSITTDTTTTTEDDR